MDIVRSAVLLVLLACSGRAAPVDTPPAPPSPTEPCESLSRSQCLSTTHCTLHKAVESALDYACRPAVGPCEEGLVQTDQAACEARDGCAFHGAECYCACQGSGRTAVEDPVTDPACSCTCGGGPPAMCHALELGGS